MVDPAGIAPAMSNWINPLRGDDCALVPAKIAWPAPRLLFTLLWKMVLSLDAPMVATSARAAAPMAIKAAQSAIKNRRKMLRSNFLPSERSIISHMCKRGVDIASKRPTHAQQISQIILRRARRWLAVVFPFEFELGEHVFGQRHPHTGIG